MNLTKVIVLLSLIGLSLPAKQPTNFKFLLPNGKLDWRRCEFGVVKQGNCRIPRQYPTNYGYGGYYNNYYRNHNCLNGYPNYQSRYSYPYNYPYSYPYNYNKYPWSQPGMNFQTPYLGYPYNTGDNWWGKKQYEKCDVGGSSNSNRNWEHLP